jgi:hypothetical protein
MAKNAVETKSYKFTRKEVSDKIKKVWNEKIFSTLNFYYFNAGYDAFKNLGKIDFVDSIKNSWDIVKFAYTPNGDWTKKPENSQTSSLLNTYLSTSSPIYKDVTDPIYDNSGIKSDQEYTDILNKIKFAQDKKSPGTYPWKDLDAKLKSEFFEYYRHYHFWLFANLIMSGKPQSTASTTDSSSKTKSSSGSTTSTTRSPKRERLNVDRNAVGERFSGL